MSECIFCNIINKEAPATVVFENEHVMSIVPLHEVSKGHILVIPKQHYVNFLDTEPTIMREVMTVTQTLAQESLAKNNADGVNIITSAGKDAGQMVFHLHMHIIPRYANDGLRIIT